MDVAEMTRNERYQNAVDRWSDVTAEIREKRKLDSLSEELFRKNPNCSVSAKSQNLIYKVIETVKPACNEQYYEILWNGGPGLNDAFIKLNPCSLKKIGSLQELKKEQSSNLIVAEIHVDGRYLLAYRGRCFWIRHETEIDTYYSLNNPIILYFPKGWNLDVIPSDFMDLKRIFDRDIGFVHEQFLDSYDPRLWGG
jgi:hypothetical protein